MFDLNEWLDANVKVVESLKEIWSGQTTNKGIEMRQTAVDFKQACLNLKQAIKNFASEPYELEQIDAETIERWAEEYDRTKGIAK